MKRKTKFFLGIDVSKLTLDISLLAVIDHDKSEMITDRFDNSVEGLKKVVKWLKKQKVPFNTDTLVVIENTGVYHRLIWSCFSTNGLPLYIGNAAHIKWSLGITRGKNDRIDSQRLCNYAFRNSDELKATPPLNPVLLQLKDLMTSRSRLLVQLGGIKVYLSELTPSSSEATLAIMKEAHQMAVDGLKASIRVLEQRIHQIIEENPVIKNNYELLKTVPGIGHLTAVYLICCTNNFSTRTTGKQLASYAGLAPFASTSGTSIKGRNKVHKMANKTLKKMLNLCAMSSIKYYPEFRYYYDRKIAEGKHPYTVLNAIRNKIVLRAAAVINMQRPYVDNYNKAA